ncbi:MAG TPA: hypothetical protein V6D17_11460 [Candidatus Obscuribacterales bacterium]
MPNLDEPIITLCSVIYESADDIERNTALTARLNPGKHWRWLVTDNRPLPHPPLLFKDERVTVLQGVEKVHDFPRGAGAYHHAAGLHLALDRVTTPYLLILDPDFFCVAPNWIDQAISHMLSNGLTFLGAPWHPKWYNKYRYFPCVHCLFIDLRHFPSQEIDFRPIYHREDLCRTLNDSSFGPLKGLTKLLLSLERQIVDRTSTSNASGLSQERSTVASSFDTGYQIYMKARAAKRLKFESFRPAFEPRSEFEGPPWAMSRFSRFLEKLLPETRCFLPKDASCYSTTKFRDLELPDVVGYGWEEFFWKDAPFGFHMRRQVRRDRSHDMEMTLLDQTLAAFVHYGNNGSQALDWKRDILSVG